MEITSEGLMTGLYIAVAVMLLIILYHVLFIVADMRKIMRRFSNLTEEFQPNSLAMMIPMLSTLTRR